MPQGVTRREFLRVTFTVGGALLIGAVLDACEVVPPTPSLLPSREPTPGAADEPFQPNLFIRIDPDGTVTLTIYRSEMGQGVRTSLAMILAEELDVDWNAVRVKQMDVDARVDQVTSGSGSVTLNFQALQDAGARARQILVAAAAQAWGVSADECTTGGSQVHHVPTNRHIGYGSLVGVAKDMQVAGTAKRKDPAAYRILGTSLPRVDDPLIVRGKALYGCDVRVPGMLYATIARCPVPGGRLVSYDSSAAGSLPGVRFIGRVSSGVAVVADDTWAAIRGRDALRLTWEDGSNAGFSTDSIREQLTNAIRRADAEHPRVSGQHRAVYETPFLAHAPMEPPNCVADVRDNECEIWAPTQNPLNVKRFVERAVNVPTSVHVTLLGGAFGRKLEVDYPVEAAEVSRAAGAPVQLFWTREDDIQHDFYRQITYHRMEAGWTAEGSLQVWRHDIAAPGLNGIAYREGVEVLREGLKVLYEVPDTSSTPLLVETPVPTGPWRAVMSAPNAFANECFLDEVAAILGKDPFDFRLSLLPEGSAVRNVLQLAATKAGWGSPLPGRHGRGIAAQIYHDTVVAMVAEASVDSGNARVHKVVCGINLGRAIHPDMVAQQIEGGVAYGLATLRSEITHRDGRVEQSNFHDYPILQLDEMPDVEVHVAPSDDPPRGLGEMGVPPIVPAVINAIFDATGIRIRHTPIRPGDLPG